MYRDKGHLCLLIGIDALLFPGPFSADAPWGWSGAWTSAAQRKSSCMHVHSHITPASADRASTEHGFQGCVDNLHGLRWPNAMPRSPNYQKSVLESVILTSQAGRGGAVGLPDA